ncbi:hypothetical protein [Burkholderia pseudomallei]|uniref:hypothetical protein n=2 Tax=Burkholderia pseudomallei TaxID=28450 RepID=UPI0015C2D4AD|nr:hypothetical protein [Burkholderia pseudomallei]
MRHAPRATCRGPIDRRCRRLRRSPSRANRIGAARPFTRQRFERAAHPLADRVGQPILGSLEGIRAHRIGREHHVGRAVVLHDPREIVERNRDRTGGRPIRSTAPVRPAERPASRMRGCARPGADATPMQHRRNTNESIQSRIESNSSALRGAPIPFI